MILRTISRSCHQVQASPLVLLALLIGVVPPFIMVSQSFYLEGNFSLHHYIQLFSEQRTWALLGRSLALALGTTVFSLPVGLILAVCCVSQHFPGKKLATALILVPLFIPSHIQAMAWTALLCSQGLLSQAPLSVSMFILILAYSPLVFLAAHAGLSARDRGMEEAGALLACPWQVWKKITLPLLGPHLCFALSLVFLLSFFNYGVPATVGLSSFPVEILARFSAYYDEGGAVALAMPIVALVLVLLVSQKQYRGKKSFFTLSGQMKKKSLSERKSLLTGLLIWGSIAFTVALPLGTLFYQSLPLHTLSLALQHASKELGTSFLVAVLSASVAVILAFLLASSSQNFSQRGRDLLQTMMLLPLAFPATVMGVGLIHLWNRPWTQALYSSIFILVVVCLARFLPFAFLILEASLAQVSPSMLEAASLCNPSRINKLLRIELLLNKKALLVSWLVVFIFAMGELGATLLVIPPGRETLSLKIYSLMHYGNGPLVAALALVLSGVNLLVSFILLSLVQR